MAEPLVKIHVHENTATILLNRPDKRNALTRAMLAELDQGLHDLHMQRSARAIVISGAGPAFCAGMDLAEMKATAESPDAKQLWEDDARAYRDVIEKMLRFPKPIIAAVDGAAVAGGAGLALACDIIVASENARFGFPEPRRGLIAGIVAPVLHFRVGAGHAAYLLLTADLIDAQRARLGYFSRSGEAGCRFSTNELAQTCAASAPEALSLTKRLLNETIGHHLPTMLAAGAAASCTARTTEAAAEGLAAFLEKREPNWE